MLDSFSTLAGLSMLADALTRTLPVVPGIVIWDQYVDLVEWSLNSLAEFFASGGLAIIAFTIIIKTVLLPLTVKSIRSSKAMQDLQPKIKELQKKYGKDRQRLSQETMALYSAYGVNPMAGCLPMLLQIPIFFGLYVAIQRVSQSDALNWADGFLWLDSLNEADPYKVLPILAGVFQFVQTRMMRPAGQGKVTDPQQAVMNQMMNFMPLMVIIFGWSFASGPVLYWATQSVYSVVQQWFITGWGSLKDWLPWLPEMPEHRRLGYHPPRDLDDVVVVSGEAPPKKGVQGWLMKRMEEAQKQAAERQGAARQPAADDGQAERSGARPDRAGASATADDDAADEAGTPAASRRGARAATNRRSTSYQARVDAATKFSGRLAREPVNGEGVGDDDVVVTGTNGRANGQAYGQADGQANGSAARRTTRPSTGNTAARTTSPQRRPSQPARPRKKRR